MAKIHLHFHGLTPAIASSETVPDFGFIWARRIGMDPVFGIGFKNTDAFKHTVFSEV